MYICLSLMGALPWDKTILPYFRPDKNFISVQILSEVFFGLLKNLKGLQILDRNSVRLIVCFKIEYALFTNLGMVHQNRSKTISFGVPHTFLADARDPPASLESWGHYLLPLHSIEQHWTCAAISRWPLGSNIRLQLTNNQLKEKTWKTLIISAVTFSKELFYLLRLF